MFELITTYYKAAEPEREAENMQCLVNNLNHPLIERVHLFLQSRDLPNVSNHNKLNLVEHGKRPMFSELFAYGNTLGTDVIKVVANSDIFFGDSLQMAQTALQKWEVLALTRWDLGRENQLSFFENFKSQDTWMFRNNLPLTALGDYFIGQYGCDNRLLFELKRSGLKIGNPSFDLKTIHIHNSGLRNYLKDPNYQFVKEPYGYITPHYLVSNNFKRFSNKSFLSLKYQYYKSAKNNKLFSLRFNYYQRIIALFKMNFYAYLVNRLK